ncbi:MAG: MOSC domain-containing protein [Polyangiaceae bacterium]|nr:MOSC domain-containing protein [Polyangiaceae bacterium]
MTSRRSTAGRGGGLLTNHLGTPARLRAHGRRHRASCRPGARSAGRPRVVRRRLPAAHRHPGIHPRGAGRGWRELDARRFRPNVVVEGAAAFDEDAWLELRLGEVRVDIVKPCGRCAMVDVDPDLGERAPGVLAELGARARSAGAAPSSARNAIPREANLHARRRGRVTRRA